MNATLYLSEGNGAILFADFQLTPKHHDGNFASYLLNWLEKSDSGSFEKMYIMEVFTSYIEEFIAVLGKFEYTYNNKSCIYHLELTTSQCELLKNHLKKQKEDMKLQGSM